MNKQKLMKLVGKLVAVSAEKKQGSILFVNMSAPPQKNDNWKEIWLNNQICCDLSQGTSREMVLLGVKRYSEDVPDTLGLFLDPEFGWCMTNLAFGFVEEVELGE